MLKLKSGLEYRVVDNKGEYKLAHLTVDHDMPLENIKEALFQFLKYIGQVQDQLKANAEAEKLAKKVEKEKVTDLPVTDEVKQVS